MIYPYSSPQILTDALFSMYGGQVNNTVLPQRQAAYLLAEEAVCKDIDTFLTPTIITGSYEFSYGLKLDHGYINELILTRFHRFDDEVYFTISGSNNNYIGIRDAELGTVDFSLYTAYYSYYRDTISCLPNRVEIIYNTGLHSGTSYSPNILLALAQYATIILNEMIGYGNETSGDWGVQNFTNQQYSEQRAKLFSTTFGNSPKAIFIHNLLKDFSRKRYVGRKERYR